jgi:uncharacterized surface protein with fasciclin (FAS1) repeats
MTRRISGRTKIAVAVFALAITAAGCGSSSDDEASSSSTTSTTAATTTTPAMTSMQPSGSACNQVPTTGEGSVMGMADDNVATAASNNPLLTTLVTAVTKAGLVDTLNSTSSPAPFTVFAPINSAFAKIPTADLNALLADKAQLSKVLTYHVVSGRYSIADLKDGQTLKTVEGQNITINKSGDTLKVNGSSTVVCGDVPTANATVMLIDTVLTPPAA